MTMKSNNEIRLTNLEALVKEAGTQEKLASAAGISRIYLNQLLKRSTASTSGKVRNIGNSTARKLEVAMDKPFGWLDQDHLDNEQIPNGYIELTYYDMSAGPGQFASVHYAPILGRKIWVLEDWALGNFGRGAVDKIKIIDNVGNAMSPTINHGDVLFVDVTQREYIMDGIYILNWNGRLLTKRLHALMDGRLAIISDNKEQYEMEYVAAKDIDQLMICGFVKKWWSMKG